MSSPTTTAYDYFVQVLECRHCGAPVTSPPSGGQFTCAYCDAVNVFSTRPAPSNELSFQSDNEIDRAAFDAAFRPTEERNMWVRAEASRPGRLNLLDPTEHVPEELRHLSAPAGLFTWTRVRFPEMRQWWQRDTRRLEEAPDDPSAAARVYWLARAMQRVHLAQARIAAQTDRNDYSERAHVLRRAVLETGLRLLDRGDRGNVLRCVLSVAACHVGDFTAARGWLSRCDPSSPNVEVDSEIRLALCALYQREGKLDQIAELLGLPDREIPFAGESRRSLAQAFRIHLYEARGLEAERRKVVRAEVQRDGTRMVVTMLSDNGLAPRTTRELHWQIARWILLFVLALLIPVLVIVAWWSAA